MSEPNNDSLHISFNDCNVHIDRMFDIHDNQQVVIQTPQPPQTPQTLQTPLSPLEQELLPIFLGDLAEVRSFLQAVDGAKPTFVIQQVNDLLRVGKVTRAGCRRPLWDIMHRFHLYKPSESNWNQQVNA